MPSWKVQHLTAEEKRKELHEKVQEKIQNVLQFEYEQAKRPIKIEELEKETEEFEQDLLGLEKPIEVEQDSQS
jgi:polyhydroxyalkanoate synthesis regulator phasin